MRHQFYYFLIFNLLFQCLYGEFRFFKNIDEYSYLSYNGQNIDIVPSDVLKEFSNVEEADCIHICNKHHNECFSIFIRYFNFTKQVSCTLLKSSTQVVKNTDHEKKTKLLTKIMKGSVDNYKRGFIKLKLCGKCEHVIRINSKTNYFCDCRQAQPEKLSSCEDAVKNTDVKTMSLFTLTMSNQVTIDPFCTVNRFKEASLLMMFRTTSDDISSYTLQNYIDGYGAMNTPYWLGLKYIAIITSLQNQLMRIEYITFDWQTVIHEYDGFRIEDNITYSMNYDQFSAKSDGKCMELKCHSDDTCLTRDDICTNIFTQKCLDDSDINFCGDFDAVFQYGDSYGLGYVYHEAMTYKNCLKTCLLSWKGGDTAIDAVTWHFDNKCYCMKHFNGLKPITHGNEVCIYSKQGCKFFPASASLARQKYQQYHNKANGESCVEACTNFKNDGGIVQTVMYNKDTKYCHCINDNVIHGYRTTLLQNITVACTSGVFCEGRCVDKKKLCDGFDDCRDTRDEKFCPTWKINNMKCDFGAPFTACTNKGHWWSNCRGENNRANAPTIPGNIQWNHDNIRALKITLSKSTILKKNMAACQDFYKGKMCRESKYLRVSQDVEVPCYPKATSRQIYTRILYRREGLQINITTNHIFNGSTNGRFQWVGFNNFAKFFADKPKEITIFRQRRENWKPRTYFYNFTTSLDGTRIFYDKKVGDVSNLPQNTSFGKCDAEQPYWWWGCTYMQPLYETTVKRFHFYSESQLTRFYWIDIIENMT